MEYVYAAMLLHKAGQPVEEGAVTKVLEAAHVKSDAAKVKALVSALHGVDIDKVAKDAMIMPVAVAAAPSAAPAEHKGKGEEKKKADDEKKSEEAAAAGLGALFG